MKKYSVFYCVAVAGGAAAFLLRMLQNRTGFEAATGLPVPGNLPALALVVLLAAAAAVLFLLSRAWPAGEGPAFPADFSTDDPKQLALPVLGSSLIGLAGLADLYEALTQNNLLLQMQTAADPYGFVMAADSLFSPKLQLLLGVLALLSAAALLLSTVACRRKDTERSYNPSVLLVVPVALVARLVLTYRADSINPALAAYYVELLALIFLTLAFYRLSSFAFAAGNLRRFVFYSGTAVLLALAALADGGPHLSALLLNAGGAVTLLGFLLRVPTE